MMKLIHHMVHDIPHKDKDTAGQESMHSGNLLDRSAGEHADSRTDGPDARDHQERK